MSSDPHTTTHHVIPLSTYLAIGCALMVLTAITVAVSFVNLGGWNAVVAVGIASLKAILVALFFMHLLYDKRIYMIVFVIGVLFLGLFIGLTMFDTLTRGELNEVSEHPIRPDAEIYREKPGTVPDTLAPVDSAAGAGNPSH
jgi:cytochrome c oxidase subunit 4